MNFKTTCTCILDRRHGKSFQKKTKFCRCFFNPLLNPFPLLANKGKASAGPTKRRKTQRDGRKEVGNAVFYDGGWGWSQFFRQIKAWCSLLFLLRGTRERPPSKDDMKRLPLNLFKLNDVQISVQDHPWICHTDSAYSK